MTLRVLFVDHETRLSGGEQDLLDLIGALGPRIEAHVALPGAGPLAESLEGVGARVHEIEIPEGLRTLSRWEIARRPHLLLGQALSAVRAVRSLMRVVDEVRPALIHTNSMKSHLLGSAAARFTGIPVVWHVRDILGPGWVRRAFRLAAGRVPLRTVCISQSVAEQFGASRHIRVIYNGIDLARFAVAAPAAWRRRLGAPAGGPLAGIVGQIARWKGQDVFVEAAAALAGSHPEARFAVVGECLFPENEGDFESQLHQMVEEGALANRVRFHGWTEEVPQIMAALDVFVHASRLPEPFGRVIVEAMAAGTPVIVSDRGAGPEIVGKGEGVIVAAGDATALASALGELFADPKRRAAVGEAGRAGAERFSITRTADGVLDLYAEIFGPEAARPAVDSCA